MKKISSKTIIIVVILLAVVVFLYRDFTAKDRAARIAEQTPEPQTNNTSNSNTGSSSNAGSSNDNSNTGSSSSSAPNYQILAGEIFNAKGYFDDDEEAVYEAFRKINTQTDYNKLKTAFISRYPSSMYNTLTLGAYSDLKSYLNTFLSTPEMAVISSILGPKGISFN